MKKKNTIIEEAFNNSLSYTEYRELIDTLLAAGKTTGPDQSERMIHYTQLNVGRMNKWDKHFEISPEVRELIQQLSSKEIWLVLSEAWCGDAAHALPIMVKMAAASPNVDLRIALRDDNPELMGLYLTDGSRSIPKLIRFTADPLEEISEWGPRPALATALVADLKGAGKPADEIKKDLQIWYARNRGKAIEDELAAMIAEDVML